MLQNLLYFCGKFTLQKSWSLLFLDNQPLYPVYTVADWFTVDRLDLQWYKVEIDWFKVGHREHRVNILKIRDAPDFILFLWKVYLTKKKYVSLSRYFRLLPCVPCAHP